MLIHVLCRFASPCCQESARGGEGERKALKKTFTPTHYTAAIEPCGGVVMLVIIVLAILLRKGKVT